MNINIYQRKEENNRDTHFSTEEGIEKK